MSDVGQELAIKRAFRHWRVYAIAESERFGRYATVLRDDHFGDEPNRLVVSPETWHRLIVAAGRNPDKFTGRYAIAFGRTPYLTLFGIELTVRPDVAGIVAEGRDRYPFSAQRYRELNRRGGLT